MITNDDGPVRKTTPTGPAWLGGLVLVLIGAYFLLVNTTGLGAVHNWWALFILIPAAAAAGTAWTQFRAEGHRLTHTVTSSLTGAAVLFLVAAIFLFNLSWAIFWPIVLIIAGSGIMLSRLSHAQPPV